MPSVKPKSAPFGPILGVVAIVGVAAIAWVVSRPKQVIKLDPTANITLEAKGVVTGSPDALVEIVEFADFECPGCGYFATLHEPDVMARLVASGEIRFRFMDFPLDMHPNAVAAHNAAACANEQGKFWEMHDAIFQTQDKWNTQATRDPKKVLQQVARDVGIDQGAWESCYDSGRQLEQIEANRRAGLRLRVGSTPSFKIGDQVYAGVMTFDEINQKVLAEKVRLMASASAQAGKAVTADDVRKQAVPVKP